MPKLHRQNTVKEHYDKHLGSFYSWMMGNFEAKQADFQKLLIELGIEPKQTKSALDLGAGHGIQSVALAKLGFKVTAIDFNKQLLEELKVNRKELRIKIVKDDIRKIKNYAYLTPELIVCCGDTITHLENKAEVEKFIQDCASALIEKGKLILSFRDYSDELKGEDRFIPVKSDDTKILTCFLEYQPKIVSVTDLLHEKQQPAGLKK